MSFWKDDLYGVNGFNEDFIGWGREDSELALRLFNKGKLSKNIKFLNNKNNYNQTVDIYLETLKTKLLSNLMSERNKMNLVKEK